MNGPKTDNVTLPSTRVDTIDTQHGRIVCVADIRGKLSQLNELAAEHNAKAIIHTGDFGFYEVSSLSRMNDRTLKHLIQYSNVISPQFRNQLNSPNLSMAEVRQMLSNPHQPSLSNGSGPSSATSSPSGFVLSEFPKLLTGELKFNVPVYTVWGACEDVSVLERLRIAPPGPISTNVSSTTNPSSQPDWSIPNLTVLSESSTRTLVMGNVRFRLFGLGGAYVPHKMFDNGEGQATIAGGQGTMWTTMLQIGELVDTAARVYDVSETRVLISHASPGREGLIAQLALALKADLTISGSLHFRYGVSYNEFSVQHDQDAFKNKFAFAKAQFEEVWTTVKAQVEAVIDDGQRKFLNNALAVTSRIPEGAPQNEETAWKNTWNWNLPDAAFGSLVLDVKDGRVSSEMRSQGFNFSYRSAAKAPPTAPANAVPTGPSKQQQQPSRPPSAPKQHQSQRSYQQYQGPQQQHQNQNHHQNQNQNQNSNYNQSQQSQQSQSGFKGKKDLKANSATDTPAQSQQSSNLPPKPDFAPPQQQAISQPMDKTDSTGKSESSIPAQPPQQDRPPSASSSRRSSYHHNKRGSAQPTGFTRSDSPSTSKASNDQLTRDQKESLTTSPAAPSPAPVKDGETENKTVPDGENVTPAQSDRGGFRGRGRGNRGGARGGGQRGSHDGGKRGRGRGQTGGPPGPTAEGLSNSTPAPAKSEGGGESGKQSNPTGNSGATNEWE